MEKMSPTAMTEARGLQSAERERIIGVTPTAAAIVVRNLAATTLPGLCSRFLQRVPLGDLLLNIIYEDDRVSHHDTANADKADKCHETKGVMRNKQSERCTKKRQRYR